MLKRMLGKRGNRMKNYKLKDEKTLCMGIYNRGQTSQNRNVWFQDVWKEKSDKRWKDYLWRWKVKFLRKSSFDVTFSHAFTINDHACTLIQYGENYELRINNNSFNYLMDLGKIYIKLEKNKLFFGQQVKKDPTSTTIINNNGKQKGNFGGSFSIK